jgi:hypothetical protein
MPKYKLPRLGRYCVYDTDNGRVHVEASSANEPRLFCLENISNGASYLPRYKAETIAWLERHSARFVSEE